MKMLVTGGAGFIGSSLVRMLIAETDHNVVVVDKLTYAGSREALAPAAESSRYRFEQVDICDRDNIERILDQYRPDTIVHLAAESHVDRSIDGPANFVETNIGGTFNLLERSRAYWCRLDGPKKKGFRFVHVSTDEVFGDLGEEGGKFRESTPYAPSSPYSATKAAADHLVRAWHRTYGLPVIVTNCSNNYGPYQFPEKLIPHMVLNALEGKALPIYGTGKQVRDWLYVEDHARALYRILKDGKAGETFIIGARSPVRNVDLVGQLCDLLEIVAPDKPAGVSRYRDLIEHVEDRPGHDLHYEIDPLKIERDLGWRPVVSFDSGLRKTVDWILRNRAWYATVTANVYTRERLGLSVAQAG